MRTLLIVALLVAIVSFVIAEEADFSFDKCKLCNAGCLFLKEQDQAKCRAVCDATICSMTFSDRSMPKTAKPTGSKTQNNKKSKLQKRVAKRMVSIMDKPSIQRLLKRQDKMDPKKFQRKLNKRLRAITRRQMIRKNAKLAGVSSVLKQRPVRRALRNEHVQRVVYKRVKKLLKQPQADLKDTKKKLKSLIVKSHKKIQKRFRRAMMLRRFRRYLKKNLSKMPANIQELSKKFAESRKSTKAALKELVVAVRAWRKEQKAAAEKVKAEKKAQKAAERKAKREEKKKVRAEKKAQKAAQKQAKKEEKAKKIAERKAKREAKLQQLSPEERKKKEEERAKKIAARKAKRDARKAKRQQRKLNVKSFLRRIQRKINPSQQPKVAKPAAASKNAKPQNVKTSFAKFRVDKCQICKQGCQFIKAADKQQKCLQVCQTVVCA